MRRTRLLLVVFALLPLHASSGFAAEAVTLDGSFVWSREDEVQTGDLTAVFTPEGEAAWAVAFHFDWEGEPHVFAGTARGSLSQGELQGNVASDQEHHKLKFEFRGSVENGTFRGTHGYFNREGELQPSGTLVLRRES